MDVLNIKTSPRTTKVVSFANDCCKFENPLKLKGYTEKYLKIKGNYLQSYKFFDEYKNEIQRLFECGTGIIERVDSSKFAQDQRHKLCVHTRVGDFIPDKLLESKKEFVEPAVKYVFEYLAKKLGKEKVVLGIFGDDQKFMKNLNFSEIPFSYIYGPSMRLRCDDFCLVSRHCDSFLMTASGSTFAWWMAYLMKNENAPIFYNSITSDFGNFSKDIHDFDIFPKEWIKLGLSKETGQIFEEKQWWYQRHGLKPDIDLS
uniref:Glycosyltransferase n=1 Tax=Panagrolaimus sp. JU765 TaxID=591449 RepID=A0AC34QDT8_9BILA